jgi:hypothetical protein
MNIPYFLLKTADLEYNIALHTLGELTFMRKLTLLLTFAGSAAMTFGQPIPGLVSASALSNARSLSFHATPHDLTNGQGHARFGIAGIDSIPNFNDHFFADGFDSAGNPNSHWYTNTVGNPPQMGGTTIINSPLQPVNVELDDANGNLLHFMGNPLISYATPFVPQTLASPVFSTALYSSGPTPTQFSDAIQRAQFFNHPMKPDWHTLLSPQVAPPLTVHIRQATTCTGGFTGCNYFFAPNSNGTCCAFILIDINPFFNALADVVVTDIVGNVITTKDISSFLFPNTYLYFTDQRDCCVLGFHTYFYDPSTSPQKIWVLNYSSWISPGLFGPAFQDVTALSHEIAETYNDPFVVSDGVHNLTPWWLAPNGNCQDDLETGDVIEGLGNATFPITMNGFTYHPQNEALLQWFEFLTPSDALGGAYSYPNTNVLTRPSAPQKPFCVP